MKNYILFFRAEKKFVEPKLAQFPFPGKSVDMATVDVGDSYDSILDNTENILAAVGLVAKLTTKIYLCGACANGFAWLLSDLLSKKFHGVCFVWLQMARGKNLPFAERKYEIWSNLINEDV